MFGRLFKSKHENKTKGKWKNKHLRPPLPSKRNKQVNSMCRATVGVVAGAGRTEKPFLKAGAKHHLMKANGHLYPRTRGIAMIAACHPFGSSKKGGRKVTTVSRNAPPGQKVGLIAARSAGCRVKQRRT